MKLSCQSCGAGFENASLSGYYKCSHCGNINYFNSEKLEISRADLKEDNIIYCKQEEAFRLIEKKTGKNPVQVLVNAIEKSSPKDEITVIEYGGARYPQAVDVAASRRISLAVRWIVQGAYDKSFNKKTKMHQALADEFIKASENSSESSAVKKRNESEKQADSAR